MLYCRQCTLVALLCLPAKINNMKYILGNNNASWILAYLLKETKLILHKTLELDYNAGPHLIQVELLDLVKQEFDVVSVLDFERFYNDRGKLTSIQPKNFGKLYSLYTRGKTITEEKYKNNYSKYQKYVSINNLSPEDSYDLLFEKIKESVNDRVIDSQIENLDISGKIHIEGKILEFERIISTINIVDLVNLDSTGKIRNSIIDNNNLEGFELPYNDKFIYVCSLEFEEDKTLSNLYKQVLVTGKPYFRKTYIGDIIIFESMKNIYSKDIEGNTIKKYIESSQISDNLNINKILGIDLVGKFSEWNENTTLETIYTRAMELKEFYSSSENNHKKVL